MSEKQTPWLRLDTANKATLENAETTDPEAQAFNVVWPVADRLLETWVKVGPTKSGWSVTIQNSSSEDLRVIYHDDYARKDDNTKKRKTRTLSFYQERTFDFEERTTEADITLRFKERDLTVVLLATNPGKTQ